MDLPELRLATDPAGLDHSSPPKELGKKRAWDGAGEAMKRAKAGYFLPANGLEGLRNSNSECSDRVQACLHFCNMKDIPGITTGSACTWHQTGRFLAMEAPCFTLGGRQCDEENGRKDLHAHPDEKNDKNRTNSGGLGLDLNAADTSNDAEAEHNLLFPYKNLGQSKVADPLTCNNTTGPTEESEPMRKWREIKQNGFLSSSHGPAMVPKLRGRPKHRKDQELRENICRNNGERNKFMKVAAPSGLLSGLNPGIINHVRNSKQVYSIIEAIVCSQKLELDNHQFFSSCNGKTRKYVSQRTQEEIHRCHLTKYHSMSTSNSTSSGEQKLYPDDDSLKLQPSPSVIMATGLTSSKSIDEPASERDFMTLSLKAASVASLWLELLQKDIKGRFAALKRSRKRVRNAIRTQLPYLTSTDFSSTQANSPIITHSSDTRYYEKAISEEHASRWRCLFTGMDTALQEEGRQLEKWLRQVQEMQSNCDKGLKQTSLEGQPLGSMSKFCKLKSSDVSEQEQAVQAAAASVYSTCDSIVRTGSVPCF